MKNLLISAVFTCLCFNLFAQPELDLIKEKVTVETINVTKANTQPFGNKFTRFYTLTYIVHSDSVYFIKIETNNDFEVQFTQAGKLLKKAKNWEVSARPFTYRPLKKDTLRIFILRDNDTYNFTLKRAIVAAKAFSYNDKLSFEEKITRLAYAARFNYANLFIGKKGMYEDSSSANGIIVNGFEAGTRENRMLQYISAVTTKDAAIKEAKKYADKLDKLFKKIKLPIVFEKLNVGDKDPYSDYIVCENRYIFLAPDNTPALSNNAQLKYYFKIKVGAYEVEDGKFAAILYIDTKD